MVEKYDGTVDEINNFISILKKIEIPEPPKEPPKEPSKKTHAAPK